MGLFGKTQEKPPKELVNEWSLKIRKEMRVVDRQIRAETAVKMVPLDPFQGFRTESEDGECRTPSHTASDCHNIQNNYTWIFPSNFFRNIQREEEKVKRSVKDAAKKGQKEVCVVLAKEMIRSRKAVSKLYASKAHMNSVLMGMKNQLAVLRVAGSLQKSTEVMKAMQSLVKIPEIQATMRELSKEMMKAGIIEEMLEDTFESMDDQEEMEEAAEMEIDRILFEITAGALGKAPSKVTDALPEPEPAGAMAASEEGEEEEDEEELEAMQSRLATLRS
ncbi:Charged multivesicular body protein 3 [Apodemus speciosus]|uniref:Charged multivesicular body protein 3 n=1 Tax=Apodemus speciosus TaxID=105296 RepID=A0ABQ0EVG2_APOSI